MFSKGFVAILRLFLKNNIAIILGGHDGFMAEMTSIYPWETHANEEFKKVQTVFSKIPLRVF
jgi:hypothetical protein